MKRFFAVFAVLATTAVLIIACSGGGGGGGGAPAPTPVTSTQQGAQSAKAGVTMAQSVMSGAVMFSTIGPGMTQPSVGGSQQSQSGKSLAKALTRLNPKIKKAKAIALANAPQDISSSMCPDGGTATTDFSETSFTYSFNNCKSFGSQETGTWTMSCTDANCTSMTFGENTTIIDYVQDFGTAGYDYTTEEAKSASNQTVTLSADSEASFALTLNGTDSREDLAGTPLPRYREENSFNQVSITGTDNSTPSVEIYSITANGIVSFISSANADGTGFVVQSSETDTLSNLSINWSRTISTGVETFSINGTYSLSVTPDDCAEGTYIFETVTPVTFDPSKGLNGAYTAGEIKINSTVVVKYITTGDVQISIDGGANFTTYTDTELDGLCPNL